MIVEHPERGKFWNEELMKTSSKPNHYLFLLVNSVMMFN